MWKNIILVGLASLALAFSGCGSDKDLGEYNNALDSDGDGLSNEMELDLGTDPENVDTDGDGISDGDEVEAGTDPLVDESAGPDFCETVGQACENGATWVCQMWEDFCRDCGGDNPCLDAAACADLWEDCDVNGGQACEDWELGCRDCSQPCADGDLCSVAGEICEAGRSDGCEIYERECS